MKMSGKPNILILYADQMQHSRMGFVDGVAYTPNLDSLANEGCHFTHAFTQHGQCVPSRAVLLTGKSAHECGVMVNYGFFEHRNMLTSENRTFAHTLREAGYATAWFGKGHLGSPLADLGFDHGDTFDAHTKNATGGRALNPEDARRLECDYVPKSIAVDYKATEDAVHFIRDFKAESSPLCLVMSLHFPHPPFFAEQRFIDRFSSENMPIPQSFQTETFADKPDFIKERAEYWRSTGFDEALLRQDMAEYYSMIAAMDDHFGRVMNEFKRRGLWDDTIVLFTADHGDMMGAHQIRAKGTFPYDELYRIPCLMKLPRNAPRPVRRVIDDLVSSRDYAGTLLCLAAVEDSNEMNDFVDSFYRDQHPNDEKVFFEHYCAHWGLHPFYGVRTRDHKYVRYYSTTDQSSTDYSFMEELYDLSLDPHELRNLTHESDYKEIKSLFRETAEKWWNDTGGKDVAYYESPEFKANSHNNQKKG